MELTRSFSGRRRAARTTARALGVFSIGLGLAEVLMPRAMSRMLGMQGREAGMVACGLREIGTGIGILMAKDPTPWIWGRVAGDALDLAVLGSGLRQSPRKAMVVGAIGAVAGVTLADLGNAKVLGELREKDRTQFKDYSDRAGLRPASERSRAKAAPLDAMKPQPGVRV